MNDVISMLYKHDEALYSQMKANRAIGRILKSQKRTDCMLVIAALYLLYENGKMKKRIEELESKVR